MKLPTLHHHRGVHRDRAGAYLYELCPGCGARRTTQVLHPATNALLPGWPDLKPRRLTSGWVRRPATGWPAPQPKPAPPTSRGATS